MCDHCGCGEPTTHSAEHAGRRSIPLEEDLLARANADGEALRRRAAEQGVRLVNIMGSPGCGKTELGIALVRRLSGQKDCAVVVGDLATDNDAQRIAQAGVPVHQVETGTACHLSAHDVGHALDHLRPERGALVLVENVGNLVCPSLFDVGESLRLVCLSVTEGADKPEKYPVAFRAANVAVITKADLAPHVDFDLALCQRLIQKVAPEMRTVVTSAKTGDGIERLAAILLAPGSSP
jgi:hydrogenase nickel incorporation protein HypB